MRYEQIRKHVQVHFSELLRGFKSDISENGPLDELRLDSLSASKSLATDDPDGFLALAYPDGVEGLLGKFCALAGIKEDLTPTDKKHLVKEIMLAFGTYAEAALLHNAEFDSIDLSEPDGAKLSSAEAFDPLAVALANRQPRGVVSPVKACAAEISIVLAASLAVTA